MLRSDSGKRTYTITARRMVSGEVMKKRKGLGLLMPEHADWPGVGSSQVLPKDPKNIFKRIFS